MTPSCLPDLSRARSLDPVGRARAIRPATRALTRDSPTQRRPVAGWPRDLPPRRLRTGTATLTDALRLWPLAIVAIGLSLVARRTRFSLPGGVLAAAVPGVVLGGALAVAPRFVGDCGARGEPPAAVRQQGTFDGPAT